jgi:hypothetical protein
MCGIFGWSLAERPNKNMRRHLKTLATVLILEMERRGTDSWGFVGDTTVVRGLGAMGDGATPDELSRYQTLVAHTRYGTVGAKTLPNAHPLRVGRVIGVHNGAVYNYTDLNKKYKRSFDVDSTHIFAHLNDGLSLKEIEGYGAVAWKLQGEPRTVRMAYWNNGDLAVWNIGDAGTVWASTGRSIDKGMRMARMNGGPYELAAKRIYVVTDGDFRRTDDELGVKQRWDSAAAAPKHVKGRWFRGHYWEDDGAADEEEAWAEYAGYGAALGNWREAHVQRSTHTRTLPNDPERRSWTESRHGKQYEIEQTVKSNGNVVTTYKPTDGEAPKALPPPPAEVRQATLDAIVAEVEAYRAEKKAEAEGGGASIDDATGAVVLPDMKEEVA